jgi:hypothetical protein
LASGAETSADTDTEGVLPPWSPNWSPALDADSLEHLDPLAVPLDDLEVDAHRVACLEGGDVTQLAPLEALDDRAHGKGRADGRSRMIAAEAGARPQVGR